MHWQASAPKIYWTVFVSWFFLIAIWESRSPRLTLNWPTGKRWGTNGILYLMCILLTPVVLRVTPIAAALTWEQNGWEGLLRVRQWHWIAALAFTFVLLDLLQYFVHRLLHAVPFFWRLHEIHHSDPDFDVGTAGRFHPLEALVTTGAQIAIIAVFTPPASAVFFSSLIALTMNFITHANASLPAKLESRIRLVLMTPDLHRIHHSADERDYSRNFGQALTVWDSLFRTKRAEPALGHDKIRVGVPGQDGERTLGLLRLLARPFEKRQRPAAAASAAAAVRRA